MNTTAELMEPKRMTDEAAQVEAIADLPRDLAIIKMENDHMFSLAASHPRDYAAVLADIKSQLSTFKTFAQSAMYAKPVGKDNSGNMTYARGLSIRAAEAIAAAYKYNRVRVAYEPLDDDRVQVEATFVDFSSSRVWQDVGIVSRNYTARGGRKARHAEDRFLNVVCKAEASKRIRECILRTVPPGLRSELELCVNEQLDSFLDDSTVQKIMAQFSTKGVTREQIEDVIGKRVESFDKTDRKNLLQIWNSIDQGEANVADIFGASAEPDGKSRTEKLTETVAKGKTKEKFDADACIKKIETMLKGTSKLPPFQRTVERHCLGDDWRKGDEAALTAGLKLVKEVASLMSKNPVDDEDALLALITDAKDMTS